MRHVASFYIAACLILSLLTSCSTEESGTKKYTALGIKFSDRNMAACIDDNGSNDISLVTDLDCFNYGIRSIDGIQNFTNIETMDLSLNDIENIDDLASLESLGIVTPPFQ